MHQQQLLVPDAANRIIELEERASSLAQENEVMRAAAATKATELVVAREEVMSPYALTHRQRETHKKYKHKHKHKHKYKHKHRHRHKHTSKI